MAAPKHQPLPGPTWAEVREELRKTVTAVKPLGFQMWFSDVTGCVEAGADGPTLHLLTPTKIHTDWLKNDFLAAIHQAWHHFVPDGTVVFTEQPQAEPERVRQPAPRNTAEASQFPPFPDETRPVSNSMARSALFAAIQGKDRQMFDNVLLATVDGIEIRFSGKQLNQDDHDVLMQLVYLARHTPLGEDVTIPGHAILKGLGRTTGKSQHQQLRDEIARLVNGGLSLRHTTRKIEYLGHLLERAAQEETSRHWVYRFNPELKVLYGNTAYTLLDWQQRVKLKGKDLARWLQLWIIGHTPQPFPVKVAYLREKCGSRAKSLRHFREKLRTALKDLEEEGVITKGWIDPETDLVHIERGAILTASQKRHVIRKKLAKKARQ